MFQPYSRPSRSHKGHNPYLSGHFTPVEPHEGSLRCQVKDAVGADVDPGTLPGELLGAYVRVGPNPQFYDPDNERYHWFDGDGMLHSIRIARTGALYSCDFVQTSRLVKDNAAGEGYMIKVFGDTMGPPDSAAMSLANFVAKHVLHTRSLDLSTGFGTANTALRFFDNMLWSLDDAELPYWVHISPDEGVISTVGRYNPFTGEVKTFSSASFSPSASIVEPSETEKKEMVDTLLAMWGLQDNKVAYNNLTMMKEWLPFNDGSFPITAHPKQLQGTGDMHVYGYDLTGLFTNYLNYGKLREGLGAPPGMPRRDISCIRNADGSPGRPVFGHEFATTLDYLIFFDNPVHFGIQNEKGKCVIQHDLSRQLKIGVLDKTGSARGMVWLEPKTTTECSLRSAVVLHVANAWQEGTTIKVYAMAFEEFKIEAMNSHIPKLVEFTIRLDTLHREYEARILYKDKGTKKPFSGEFPVIAPDYIGKPNRFIYIVSAESGDPGFTRIVKVDLKQPSASKRSKAFAGVQQESTASGGEAIFVPCSRPGAEEDEGYLLMLLSDDPGDDGNMQGCSTRLMIYDSENLEVKYQIILQDKSGTPLRVPTGLHGIHLTEEQLSAADKHMKQMQRSNQLMQHQLLGRKLDALQDAVKGLQVQVAGLKELM